MLVVEYVALATSCAALVPVEELGALAASAVGDIKGILHDEFSRHGGEGTC